MMNKAKKVLASFMAVALVICVGYFSSMSKTSAWFYDSGTVDSGNSFVFGNLSVDTKFIINNPVLFEAATKLADDSEILFDKAVNVDDISVKNSGTIPARVYIKAVNEDSTKGCRWFAFTDDMLVDSSIRKTVKANVRSLDESGLNDYNNSKYFLLAPGESKNIKVASWIEYDDVSSSISDGKSIEFNMRIYMTASQDKDGVVS